CPTGEAGAAGAPRAPVPVGLSFEHNLVFDLRGPVGRHLCALVGAQHVTSFRAVVPWLGSASPPTKKDLAAAPARPLPQDALDRAAAGVAVPAGSWGTDSERGLRGWARVLAQRYDHAL
ncbi:MAG TPA: hypothetical protein VFP36_13415, partial [Usitatibacter sp.]|nr:hypothetical protein [Usitatibacter sp.]